MAAPETLGRQLHMIYDGASLSARMDHDPTASVAARAAAETLLDAALLDAALPAPAFGTAPRRPRPGRRDGGPAQPVTWRAAGAGSVLRRPSRPAVVVPLKPRPARCAHSPAEMAAGSAAGSG